MIKKLLFIFLIASSVFGFQEELDNFSDGLKNYLQKNYSIAIDLFSKVANDSRSDQEKIELAKYYIADCMLQINELDGAAAHYERFIDQYRFSNFREEALFKLGSVYYANNEFRKSREKLFQLLAEYPSTKQKGTSYYWIAQAFTNERNYFEAENYFKLAINPSNKNVYLEYAIFSLGQLYERMSNYSEAVKQYDELLAYYKQSILAPFTQLRIGVCYFELKEYDSAVLELTDPLLKELPPEKQFEARYFLANSFSRLKEYKNAADIYSEILSSQIDGQIKEKINYSLAWINFQLREYDKAYTIYNDLSKSADDSLAINSLYWSGECKRYQGDTKTADQIFKSFVEKYPAHYLTSRAQLGLGSIYFTSDKSADAEKSLFNASVSNDPLTKGKANTLLGEISLNKKDFENAKNYFNTALKFTTKDADQNNRAKLGLAVTEFYLNNYNPAVKLLEDLSNNYKSFEKDKVSFYLAECYSMRGEYSAAVKFYNQVNSNIDLLKKQTLYGKAYAHFNLKDFPNSIYYFNDYLNKYGKDPSSSDAKLRLADSYYGIKNFDKASVIYRELFSQNRNAINDDFTYYQYSQSLYKAGKIKDAVEAFKTLQQKFPRSKYADASQYVIGWIHFQQSDFGSSINSYEELISKYPKSPLVPIGLYSIGDSYFNLGNYDSSIVFYSKVLADYPNTQYILDAVNGIQYAYVAKDQPDYAVTFIDQYISNNPNSRFGDQIFFKKGDILYSAENYDKAITSYQEFLVRFPSSALVPNAYYWIGKSAANLKKEGDAISNFSKVTERWLKTDIGISSVVELAKIYSDKKQFANSVSVLETALTAVPTSNRVPELLYLKGTAEVKDNKSDQAIQTFDQIIKYYDVSIFSAKAKLELGLIELARNNYEASQIYFRELGEKRTDDLGAQAQYYYGLSLFNQDKITEAITAFVRIRSVFAGFDEWYTRSLLMLGDCYVKLKDKQQAREMYKAVISRHQTGELAQEAKRKLNRL